MKADQARRALQWLLGGTLLAFAWKAGYWLAAAHDLARTPLADPFFPSAFASLVTLGAGLVLPTLALCTALLWHRLSVARAAFITTACASLLLMLHQASYNDASFVTSFWSSLYGLWLVRALATHQHETFPSLLASRLARCFVSLMFLGGAVGKLTPGYWDGSVLYALNFATNDYWSFRLLRSLLTATQLREAATLYSRCVVLVELVLVTLALWPARVALYTASVALVAMVVLNNHLLLSVVGPLLGMCGAALYVAPMGVVPAAAPRSPHGRLEPDAPRYADRASS